MFIYFVFILKLKDKKKYSFLYRENEWFFMKRVSHFLFQNVTRGVKEITMMGMGLGPHTYQVLFFTFPILFLTEFDDTSVNSLVILNFFFHFSSRLWCLFAFLLFGIWGLGETSDGYRFGGPIFIRLFSLNFHISSFRNEIKTFLQSD